MRRKNHVPAAGGRSFRLMHVTTVPETLGFFVGQVGYLKERGFEVQAVSSPGPLLEDFAQRETIPVHAVDMSRKIAPAADVKSLGRLVGILRRQRPDMVHAHTPKAGLLGMLAAWFCRVPVRVYTVHGLPFMTATGLRRKLLRWAEKVSCVLAHQVLCVSSSIRGVMVSEGLCRATKIKVLHNGSINGVAAEDRFNPASLSESVRSAVRRRLGIPSDAPVVGFVGRIVRDKGLIELVKAWEELREEPRNLHLLVVGPFEPQDPLPGEVEQVLRRDPRIHLAGADWHTPPLYRAMDMLVLPTYREGFPVVPLEAAAMELPVVATRIPGCIDAIEDGITGTLVPVRDARELAKAIRRYITDAALRTRHGRAARERVRRDFSQRDVWQALHREYLGILTARGLLASDGCAPETVAARLATSP
jgi:glycosyltransferase involved in cell wall biosynthesis